MGSCCGCPKKTKITVVNPTEDHTNSNHGQGLKVITEESGHRPVFDLSTPSSAGRITINGDQRRAPSAAMASMLHSQPSVTNLLSQYQPENVHVLLCDDDEHTMEFLVKFLEEKRYTVTPCYGADEALDVLAMAAQEIEGSIQDFDIVICDASMTTEEGPTLLDCILGSDRTKQIPVILMGGDDSSAQSAGRVIRRGGQDFLQKPIAGAVLVKTIQTILENIIERENAEAMKARGDKYKELLKAEQLAHSDTLTASTTLIGTTQPLTPVAGQSNNNQSLAPMRSNSTFGDGKLSPASPSGMGARMDYLHATAPSPYSGHRSITPPGLLREGSKTYFQNVHILVVEPDERIRDELKTWLAEVLFRVTSCATATKALEYLLAVHRHPPNLLMHHGSPPVTPLPGQRDGNASPSTTKPLEVRFKSKEIQYSSVTDGEEKHGGSEVDLIIADADMTPITGHQLLEKVFSEPNCRHIPVVLMSGVNTSPRHASGALKEGSEGYLVKPLTRDVFLKKISTIITNVAQKRYSMVLIERARKYKRALEQLRREREHRRAEMKRKRDAIGGLGSGSERAGSIINGTTITGTGSIKGSGEMGSPQQPQRATGLATSSRHAPRVLPNNGSREMTLTGTGSAMGGSGHNLRLFEQRRSISMKRLDEASSPVLHGGPRTNSSMGFVSPPGSPGPHGMGRLALLGIQGGNTPPGERRRLSSASHHPPPVEVHSPASRLQNGFDVTIPTPGSSRFHFPQGNNAAGGHQQQASGHSSGASSIHGTPPQNPLVIHSGAHNPAHISISPNGTIGSNSMLTLTSPSEARAFAGGINGTISGTTHSMTQTNQPLGATPPHTPSLTSSTLPAVLSSRAGPIVIGSTPPSMPLQPLNTSATSLPPPERMITPPGVMSGA